MTAHAMSISMNSDHDEDSLTDDFCLFEEPEGYFQAEKPPTSATHELLSGETVTVRLVGHNPLWGHLLWNAGRVISNYLEERSETLIRGRDILELGAGAGLPSLVCAKRDARSVVVTDYPDPDLIENLRHNISHCNLPAGVDNIHAEGYLWGASAETVRSYLRDPATGFDILILADLLFNHSEHSKLIASIEQCLRKSRTAQALVFFTPYRPWLLEKDLAFFDLARSAGFKVEKILEKVMDKVLFEKDPGDELLRRTVYGYEVRWGDGKNPEKQ
ncbi:nicotinamide N-methyltransferas-like protein Nnt1 [Xylona heveae TC161]|uniref:Protein N-terminal and lysine N-methyltransferase EFM7 n=1 Tax=Xylona heveae (strain CBS 132557 / TC161) TaxID=1328760 RepID=A0A165HK32_XYLHT|nr:nicotinamide N-methyltransferas-like protein Nnt1 [Xylona heveae TC161]KZF23632.1 nicotinamide N-methyltransferas-like protein Nnt1 [Xylona heveae TC161]